jgi:lipopolysaccharide export system protein LptA
MRRTRRLLLLLMVLILGTVGSVYYRQKAFQAASATPPPPPMKHGVSASSQDWVYRKDDGRCPVVEVRAQDVATAESPDERILLKRVELKLFHACGAKYDYVRSESAEFNKTAETMYSDGDVELTLAVPSSEEELAKPGRLLTIRSSGVIVEAATGKARTDRLTRFAFDLGDGHATGAAYDPQLRQLDLISSAVLNWRGREPGQKPMIIEAGSLIYTEADSMVRLSPWSRFKRENLSLEAAGSVITIDKGNIRLVEAQKAKGTDRYPNRMLQFGANEMRMELSAKSEVEKIAGTGEAMLEATSESGRTRVTTDRIDLGFVVAEGNSILEKALASGNARVESHPAAKPGKPAPTRILQSEVIEAKMRAGGEELDTMDTHSAGTLDLFPNAPEQPRRHMKAQRLWIAYAARNQLKSFRAVEVATETFKPRQPKATADPPPALTWSRDLLAEFDGETSEMTKLEQWNDFRYQEGARQAAAQHATLDPRTHLIALDRGERQPRAWDPAGSVTADRIVLHEQTGDFTAQGKVASTRQPDKKTVNANGMLSQDEPMHATADRMTSSDRNQKVRYEGNAVLWQTANRLQADSVFIDRTAKILTAEGKVVTQFLDKKINPKTGKAPVTIINARSLDYRDQDRYAIYQGPVRMIRDDMDVKSRQLRAWLNESRSGSEDSSLHHAFADGSVEIVQTEPDRTRRGTSEHAEFWVAEDKMILNGGPAQLADSLKGTARGRQLTYFSRNDSLLVEGAVTQPAVSKVRRQ